MQPQPRLSLPTAPALQQPAQRAPLVLPALTLYRDGSANLNGEATRLLHPAASLTLLPPGRPGARWQLLPHPVRDEEAVALNMDRGQLRFRSAPLATALFAALPESQKSLRLALLPTDGPTFKLVAR